MTLCYKDKTFCMSPDCTNECGRKLTEEDKMKAQELGMLISAALFCGIPETKEDKWTVRNDKN